MGPRAAVSDFTYVRTWSGFVYTAFVIDVFARRIVGWKVSRTPTAEFVLHALEQALHERRPCERSDDLVHHSDRGVQYVSIKYGERLAEAGIAPSVGSVGDSYDNALAETIIGLYKTEVIGQRGRGGASRMSSSPPSNGSIGSTTVVCSTRSGISRQQRPKQTSTRSLPRPGSPRRTQTNQPPENPARFNLSKRFQSRMRAAKLRHSGAAIEDVDYRTPRKLDKALFQNLATGRWITEKRNLLITGPSDLAS